MHCHYNFECCGKYILEKEKNNNMVFDYLIRPDLYFIKDCDSIDKYDNSKITLGTGPNCYNNDHIAIIPRLHFNSFFLIE